MNSGDWFALDSLYKVSPKDSISGFLEVYGRCLIGNRFNRPEVSIPAFEDLLENHYQSLSLSQILNSAVMCAIDLSRLGENSKAASILSSVKDRIGNSEAARKFEKFLAQYSALAEFNPYTITFEGDTGCICFHTVPVGRPDDKGLHIHLEESFINGLPADIIFDTGAAVNIISTSSAEKYNLKPLDVTTTVWGEKSHDGTFAIARQLMIGNITLTDVPFYVMDITANNEEANQYMRTLNIIVGSDIMLQLKDLTFDFENSRIIVPVEAPAKTDSAPNICFSSGMNLLAKGSILGNDLLMNIDTGDSGYGSIGKDFYKKNKKYVKSRGCETDIRRAGIGGVNISKGYKVPDMSLDLGGNTVTVPTFNVMVKTDSSGGYSCNIGLKSLMLYKTVRFNLVDFVLTTTGTADTE